MGSAGGERAPVPRWTPRLPAATQVREGTTSQPLRSGPDTVWGFEWAPRGLRLCPLTWSW